MSSRVRVCFAPTLAAYALSAGSTIFSRRALRGLLASGEFELDLLDVDVDDLAGGVGRWHGRRDEQLDWGVAIA